MPACDWFIYSQLILSGISSLPILFCELPIESPLFTVSYYIWWWRKHVYERIISNKLVWYIYIYIYINTEWPKKCIHSLLINIFGINLNEISISGWEWNIIYNSRISLISILLLYKYSGYGYSVIFFMSKVCVHFWNHSVYIYICVCVCVCVCVCIEIR